MMSTIRIAVVVAAVLCADLPSQLEWQARAESVWRSHVRMVYDSARGRLVLFGGVDGMWSSQVVVGDLLESDDGPWRLVTPQGPAPSGRWSHAIAFDAARGRTVVFGGIDAVTRAQLDDTWTWDGVAWRREAAGPPARHACAMAYDPNRRRVVLFGGFLRGGALADDTWEWDGSSWTRMQPATSPPARWGHQIVFDPVRRRIVLAGGGVANQTAFDLWEWDGVTWSPRPTPVSPPARADFGIAFDVARGRLVLHGAGYPTALSSETWELDGNRWTLLRPRNQVSAGRHALAYDARRQRVVMFGTDDSLMHEWDGQDWIVDGSRSGPGPAAGARILWDTVRERTLLIGTKPTARHHLWTFAGDRWRPVDVGYATTGVAPPHIVDAGWAFDTRRGVAMLFGGSDGSSRDDLWEFDGSRWWQSTAARPPHRSGHVFVYDAARGRAVAFGGEASSPNNFLDDTWLWDGTGWFGVTPRHVPPARAHAAAAYDPVRGRVVMFGGRSVWGVVFADTWEWDGADWAWRHPATSPPARGGASMGWDAARHRCVLVLGDVYDANVWEWDGVDWTPRTVANPPTARERSGFAFDAVRGELVAYGGALSAYGVPSGETHVLAPVDPARFESFAAGCTGANPRLVPRSLPWIDTTFEIAVDGYPAGASVLLWCGFSNQSTGGAPLPLPLDAIGMPGCQLLVSLDVPLAMPSSGTGAPSVAIPIPNDRALLAGRLYLQAFGIAPAANPLGVAATDGVAATLGAR